MNKILLKNIKVGFHYVNYFLFLILYRLLFLIRKEKNINKSIIVSEVYKKKTIYILYMKKYIIIISILSLLCIALCFRPKLKEGFECPNRLVKRDNKLILLRNGKIIKEFDSMKDYLKYYKFYTSNYLAKNKTCPPLSAVEDVNLYVSKDALSQNWAGTSSSKLYYNVEHFQSGPPSKSQTSAVSQESQQKQLLHSPPVPQEQFLYAPQTPVKQTHKSKTFPYAEDLEILPEEEQYIVSSNLAPLEEEAVFQETVNQEAVFQEAITQEEAAQEKQISLPASVPTQEESVNSNELQQVSQESSMPTEYCSEHSSCGKNKFCNKNNKCKNKLFCIEGENGNSVNLKCPKMSNKLMIVEEIILKYYKNGTPKCDKSLFEIALDTHLLNYFAKQGYIDESDKDDDAVVTAKLNNLNDNKVMNIINFIKNSPSSCEELIKLYDTRNIQNIQAEAEAEAEAKSSKLSRPGITKKSGSFNNMFLNEQAGFNTVFNQRENRRSGNMVTNNYYDIDIEHSAGKFGHKIKKKTEYPLKTQNQTVVSQKPKELSYDPTINTSTSEEHSACGYSFVDPAYWRVPQRRPPVCISNSPNKNLPAPIISKGTPLDALQYTKVGSIMPKFTYKEQH